MIRLFAGLTALALLAACNPGATPQPVLSMNPLIWSCADLKLSESEAPAESKSAAKLTHIAAPYDAYCAILNAGVLPGNTDANTVPWLQNGVAMVVTAKALAGPGPATVLKIIPDAADPQSFQIVRAQADSAYIQDAQTTIDALVASATARE